MDLRLFDEAPIKALSVPDHLFTDDGMRLIDPRSAADTFGKKLAFAASAALPVVVEGGVQSAESGIIQDPAGSAIGTMSFNGGNASGSIYRRFNDLPDPKDHLAFIPDMPAGAAVFNGSTGAGRRVLHSHSPFLRGSPAHGIDRGEALAALANTYFNAFKATAYRCHDLGEDGQLLNLVPVSASLYANAFAGHRPGWKVSHLDPGYTITAIQMASAEAASQSLDIPSLRLYYYAPEVCRTAEDIINSLGSP